MKPLPEAVQRAFPCAPGCLPERPWWRPTYGDERGAVYERRIAGAWHPVLVYTDPVRGLCRGVTPLPEGTLPLFDAMAAIDARAPEPHPGYRAGQVWANEHGGAVVLLNSHPLMRCAVVDETDRPLALSELGSTYPYLMADPACPHLAPWSPCEVKP